MAPIPPDNANVVFGQASGFVCAPSSLSNIVLAMVASRTCATYQRILT